MTTGRCPWALSSEAMLAYHDTEWGRPFVPGAGGGSGCRAGSGAGSSLDASDAAEAADAAMFRRTCLELFQAGLSWALVLARRDLLAEALAGFDPAALAGWGEADIDRAIGAPGMIRNRAKLKAVVGNARATVALRADGASLNAIVWSYRPSSDPTPRAPGDVASRSPESVALAKELARRGFSFIGPTSAYATMQAAGIVNDHLSGCPIRAEVERLRQQVSSACASR
ncbi:MAG: DNA-3-methyladenine glycosylase I [Acidimicrobiales bacterium]